MLFTNKTVRVNEKSPIFSKKKKKNRCRQEGHNRSLVHYGQLYRS